MESLLDELSRALVDHSGKRWAQGLIYAVVLLIGATPWGLTFTLFQAAPLMVQLPPSSPSGPPSGLPEGPGISAYLALSIQVANLVIFGYCAVLERVTSGHPAHVRRRLASISVAGVYGLIVASNTAAAALLTCASELSEDEHACDGFVVAEVFGARRSVGLYAIGLSAGLSGSGAFLLGVPLLAAYRSVYTAAYFSGNGSMAMLVAVVGSAQVFGASAASPNFSVADFFAIFAALSALSAGALAFVFGLEMRLPKLGLGLIAAGGEQSEDDSGESMGSAVEPLENGGGDRSEQPLLIERREFGTKGGEESISVGGGEAPHPRGSGVLGLCALQAGAGALNYGLSAPAFLRASERMTSALPGLPSYCPAVTAVFATAGFSASSWLPHALRPLPPARTLACVWCAATAGFLLPALGLVVPRGILGPVLLVADCAVFAFCCSCSISHHQIEAAELCAAGNAQAPQRVSYALQVGALTGALASFLLLSGG